jgi:hypothetical protein
MKYVLCVGMYRACSTWQYEVASHLLERHRGAQRLGYVQGDEFAALERRWRHRVDDWAVLKSHDEHPAFVEALERGRALAVYSYRDLRDVAFSLAHKRGTTLEGIVRLGMLHQTLANDRVWQAQSPERRLIQQYEALIANPVRGVRELAGFLGVDLRPSEAQGLAAEYSLEANRERTEAVSRRLLAEGVDLTDPANALRCDGLTLLHWNHLREGRVGGWRDQASPTQIALLARFVADWLIEEGYETDGSWASPGSDWSEWLFREVEAARGWTNFQAARWSRHHPRTSRTIRRLLSRPQPVTAVTMSSDPPPAPRVHRRSA